MKRRIIRESWYWPTVKKVAENRFRNAESKTDVLLELDIRAGQCCEYFGRDPLACKDCYNYSIFNLRKEGAEKS